MASNVISANPGALLPVTDVVVYTVPAGTSAMVSKLTLSNTGPDAAVVTVQLSSSNVSNSTSFLQALTVPANGTVSVPAAAQHVIPANGTILARASIPNVVIIKLSTVLFTG